MEDGKAEANGVAEENGGNETEVGKAIGAICARCNSDGIWSVIDKPLAEHTVDEGDIVALKHADGRILVARVTVEGTRLLTGARCPSVSPFVFDILGTYRQEEDIKYNKSPCGKKWVPYGWIDFRIDISDLIERKIMSRKTHHNDTAQSSPWEVDFHQLGISRSQDFDHLAQHPASHQNMDSDADAPNKEPVEARAGDFCIASANFGIGSKTVVDFITECEPEYNAIEDTDVLKVTLSNAHTLGFTDTVMLFRIDKDGHLQHASDGEFVCHSQLYGIHAQLKKGTYPEMTDQLRKKRLELCKKNGVYKDEREESEAKSKANTPNHFNDGVDEVILGLLDLFINNKAHPKKKSKVAPPGLDSCPSDNSQQRTFARAVGVGGSCSTGVPITSFSELYMPSQPHAPHSTHKPEAQPKNLTVHLWVGLPSLAGQVALTPNQVQLSDIIFRSYSGPVMKMKEWVLDLLEQAIEARASEQSQFEAQAEDQAQATQTQTQQQGCALEFETAFNLATNAATPRPQTFAQRDPASAKLQRDLVTKERDIPFFQEYIRLCVFFSLHGSRAPKTTTAHAQVLKGLGTLLELAPLLSVSKDSRALYHNLCTLTSLSHASYC